MSQTQPTFPKTSILRVGIVGSRTYPCYEDVFRLVHDIIVQNPGRLIEFVSGGNPKGTDAFVKQAVEMLLFAHTNIRYIEFAPAHYNGAPYDVQNYHIRNEQIAKYCSIVYAFLFGESRGTRSTIEFCHKHNTPVVIHRTLLCTNNTGGEALAGIAG